MLTDQIHLEFCSEYEGTKTPLKKRRSSFSRNELFNSTLIESFFF